MNVKSLALFGLLGIGFLLGMVFLLWNFGNTEPSASDVAGEMRNVKGSGEIVVVEFSDFQCPYCAAVQDPNEVKAIGSELLSIPELSEKYQGKIKFAYRHYPLTSTHKNAQMAAQAAEAAGEQNKFFEYHDVLFAQQEEWSLSDKANEVFVGYAEDLGMDGEKFKTEMTSKEIQARVNLDAAAATRLRITGTPSFFVNGIKTDFEELETRIKSLVE